MWNYEFTYISNLKNKMNFKKWKQTNKQKMETDSQIQRRNRWFPEEKGQGNKRNK